MALVKEVFRDEPRVAVESFNSLLIDYVQSKGAGSIVRGLRAVSDFEYEFQMALMNRKLERDIETVFMMTDFKWMYLSSTIVKEVAEYRGDVRGLVPGPVVNALAVKLGYEPGGKKKGMSGRPPIVCLLGPTGTGKTGAAIALSRNRPVSVINFDSRQVYADFPLITAQPDARERAAMSPSSLWFFAYRGKDDCRSVRRTSRGKDRRGSGRGAFTPYWWVGPVCICVHCFQVSHPSPRYPGTLGSGF